MHTNVGTLEDLAVPSPVALSAVAARHVVGLVLAGALIVVTNTNQHIFVFFLFFHEYIFMIILIYFTDK